MNVDRWKKAGAAAVIVIAAGFTIYYVLYGFPEPVKHQRYITDQTALRVMLRPSKVQHIVSDAVPDALKFIPAMPRLNSTMGQPQRLDWLHYLPHEVTLIVDQSPTGDLAGILFVNDEEAGPDFAEIVSDSRVLAERIPFTWQPPTLARDAEEALTARGTFDIEEVAWQAPSLARVGGPFSLPEPKGSLIADVAVDNSGAVLQAMHLGLRHFHGPALGDPQVDETLYELWERVLTLHLRASLEDEETIHIGIDLALDAPLEDVSRLEHAAEALRYLLADETGLSLEGGLERTSVGLHAEYQIIGIASRLHEALGRRGI